MGKGLFRMLLITLLLPALRGAAQPAGTVWPNPEAEQAYQQGRQYLNTGNFPLAITAFRQALSRAPTQRFIRKDLAQAYLFSGNSEQAYKQISPEIEAGHADAETYQIAAASLGAGGDRKKARRMLAQGLEKYPKAGPLYFELGKQYDDDNQPDEALKQWLAGIAADPGYRINYYEAAKLYALSNEPLWALLYAEIFINLERSTPRSADARRLLYSTYRKVFLQAQNGLPLTAGTGNAFEKAVTATFETAAPVMLDGISTENLTMLRTRFSTVWARTQSGLPFVLFRYWDQLLREGQFDAYNQWLFGQAEADKQYLAWKGFHPEAIPALERWLTAQPLQPTAADDFNDRRLKGVLPQPQQSPYR